MENQDFAQRIQEKIERLTGGPIELRIDHEDANQLEVDLESNPPVVTLGSAIYKYAGFARMGIEYAVACIRQRRPVDVMEFHLLLARN